MDPFLLGIVGFGVMFLFIALGVPVAMALGGVGVLGLLYMGGLIPTLQQVVSTNWITVTGIVICAVPLFVFMGQLVFHSGVAADLYATFFRWVGRLPGGLAIATSFSCAAFGSVSGSSVATVATMGSIAIPQMKRFKYNNVMATGCLAASGTLGSMIPPSIDMIIYGILTETSIGRLFIAGILPGILEAISYSVMILFRCIRNITLGPRGPDFSWPEKFASLRGVLPVLALFLLVLGGIYGGVFTATEAGGAGAFTAFVLLLSMRRLTLERIKAALLSTGRISAMIMTLIVGGLLFSRFLVMTGVAPAIIDFIVLFPANRYVIVFLIFGVYILLGMAMNVSTLLILTVPITYPIFMELGFDGVWFGILVVKMCEIALITPPVGANLFVMKSIAPDVPMGDIFRGILPFVLVDFANIAILVAFPMISLFLPSLMF